MSIQSYKHLRENLAEMFWINLGEYIRSAAWEQMTHKDAARSSLTRTSRNQKGFKHEGHKVREVIRIKAEGFPFVTFVSLRQAQYKPLCLKYSCFLYKDLIAKGL